MLWFDEESGKFVRKTSNPGLFGVVNKQKPKLEDENVIGFFLNVTHQILILLVCPVHDRILLRKHLNDYFFLPTFPFQPDGEYNNQINRWIDHLIGVIFKNQTSRIKCEWHIQMFNQFKSLPKCVVLDQMFVRVSIKNCSSTAILCCNDADSYFWKSSVEAQNPFNELIWGNEIRSLLKESKITKVCENLTIPDWNLLLRQHPRMRFKEIDLRYTLKIFLYINWPSSVMNFASFTAFLNTIKVKFEINSRIFTVKRLFNAFCRCSDEMTFEELIRGILCTGPTAEHREAGGMYRIHLIYNYYCDNPKRGMSFENLKTLIIDVQQEQDALVRKKAKECFKALDLLPGQDYIFESGLYALVDREILCGASTLLRNTDAENLFRRLTVRRRPFMKLQEFSQQDILANVGVPVKPINNRYQCDDCKRTTNLKLSPHVVDLKRGNLPGAIRYRMAENRLKSPIGQELLNSPTNVLDPTNFAKELLDMIHLWGTAVFSRYPDRSNRGKWEKIRSADPSTAPYIDKILLFLNDCQAEYKKSPRKIHIRSPVLIFGDTHGNYRDLCVYARMFFPLAPSVIPYKVLFLGDYVDRGENSVETVLHLLALKMIVPEKFFLLRGNHEDRTVHKIFTFHQECTVKFGPKFGEQVWNAFNKVFDSLPIAAVVDEQIFCAHGGIPVTTMQVEVIDELCAEMEVGYSEMCTEILWNDPWPNDTIPPPTLEEKLQRNPYSVFPYGCVANTQRGTGSFYGEIALKRFFDINNYKLLIRAHECQEKGYKVMMNGKMITVFSCSHYCGMSNNSGAVLIDSFHKIRLFRIIMPAMNSNPMNGYSS